VIVYLWCAGARWSGLSETLERAQDVAGEHAGTGGDAWVGLARIARNEHLETIYERLGSTWTAQGRDADGRPRWVMSQHPAPALAGTVPAAPW
jgi:hypothetical protein